MTADLATRIADLPPGGNLFDIFTAAEFGSAAAAALKDGEPATAAGLMIEMAKRHPHEAELLYQAMRVRAAMFDEGGE